MKRKRTSPFSHLPFPLRLIFIFLLTSMLSLAMSLYLNTNINRSLEQINTIYTSNNNLNIMTETLDSLHNNILEYLEVKSTDSLNNYYYYEQQYRNLLSDLNHQVTDSTAGSMEKNIYNISQSYLAIADEAIEAKRARNTGKYRTAYNEATDYYHFLTAYIYSLNNQQFLANSRNYQSLEVSLRLIERMNTLVTIAMALFNIFLIIIMVNQITRPLLLLASASNQVAAGNFDVELPPVVSDDELGVVTLAFSKMVISIQEYIEKVKSSIKAEKEAQERELLMETHLKEAQLRYYQAQINPHFLFNSLNAGAQMAMMEDAEKTYSFIQNMADFFRYSMKSLNTDVDLQEEIELVDNYVSIMNVRFSGDIHFEKSIDCDITGVRVPCMIIQPAVENAISYGIRNISREGKIRLEVHREGSEILIHVRDNGIGISSERLQDIRSGKTAHTSSDKNSNGVGLGNVQKRLNLYYNKENLFSIDSKGENMGTLVTIRIPVEEEQYV